MRFLCGLLFAVLPILAQTDVARPMQPGQLQNTFTAPPLIPREKFHYRVTEDFTYRAFLSNAVGSAFAQWEDTPSAWGDGFAGYSKRFASGFGQTLARQSVALAIDDGMHLDPRYFPSTESGFKARLWNVVKQIYLMKRDDGRTTFAYSRVTSAFVAGQVVNAWEPSGNNSVTNGLLRGVITLGVDGLGNFGQEFVPFTRPKELRHRH